MLQSPQPAATAEAAPPAIQSEPALVGRVLLVEDDQNVHRVIRLLLRKTDLSIDAAMNGQMACDMAEHSRAEGRPYDLILMDIQMPGMNGYEATQKLRQSGWQGPIIALTAHAMAGHREKCFAAGCSDYIAKPVARAELRDIISRHLPRAESLLSLQK